MIDQVRPPELAAWIRSQAAAGGAPAVVLDVREPAELQAASVKPAGFELIAIPMSELALRLGELDQKRPIACLCHHGNRSQRVAQFLAGNGYARVANIAGGIEAWALELDGSVPRY